MATLQVSRKRSIECDDRLRKAIDDLRTKYPKSEENGILNACSAARAHMKSIFRQTLNFELD